MLFPAYNIFYCAGIKSVKVLCRTVKLSVLDSTVRVAVGFLIFGPKGELKSDTRILMFEKFSRNEFFTEMKSIRNSNRLFRVSFVI
jgi:hypothetical protein